MRAKETPVDTEDTSAQRNPRTHQRVFCVGSQYYDPTGDRSQSGVELGEGNEVTGVTAECPS